MKTYTRKLLFIVLIALIGSCTKERDELLLVEKTPEQEIIREISLIVGKVLTDPHVKREVLAAMDFVDGDFNELVSIPYLMGSTSNLKKNEYAVVSSFSMKRAYHTLFRKAVSREFNFNKVKYPALRREIIDRVTESNNLKHSALETTEHFAQLLKNTHYQIYFPYSYQMDPQEALTSFYVSYDPLNGENTNEGFFFETGTEGYIHIDEMNIDYTFENPVFGIIPIDPCDIPGAPCDFVYLQGITEEEKKVIDPGLPPFAGLPPVHHGRPKLITYNFHHRHVIDGEDMISSYIPYIRIYNNTSWMGFMASHQKLGFFRAGPSTIVTISPEGQKSVQGIEHTVSEVRMRVRKIRNKAWFPLHGEFDINWTMVENMQSLAVFSYHCFRLPSAEIEAKFKAGLTKNQTTNKWVPSVEATFSGKVNIKKGGARFRAIVELERKPVFLTNVSGPETWTVNGVPFTLRRIGIVDYYFNHWHTCLIK